MDVHIRPHTLAGAVTPPPSKSMAHRLLLAAALADGVSTVQNVALSQDIEATLRCMAALGASWERTDKSTLRVTGIGGKRKPFPEIPRFDCGESGSTLRFLIPIALAVAGGGVFTGRGRLMERPQKPYFDLFDEKGISYEQTAGALTVRGALTPGEYRLAGNVSSQFFTGLLFALPLLGGGSTLVSTTRLESRDYVAMTRDALARAGVRVDGEAERFAVPPEKAGTPRTVRLSSVSSAGTPSARSSAAVVDRRSLSFIRRRAALTKCVVPSRRAAITASGGSRSGQSDTSTLCSPAGLNRS